MIHPLKFEDRDLELTWDDDTYRSKAAAMRAYGSDVADPDPAWGSVYVTAQDVEDERETVAIETTFI